MLRTPAPLIGALGVMKSFLRSFVHSLTKDDLFIRILFLLLGSGIGGLGLYGLHWTITNDTSQDPVWFQMLLWLIATLLAVWGVLLICRFFVPRGSWLARLAEKLSPDSADEGALVLLVVFCLPAVLVTLLCRLVGVRGSTESSGTASPK